MPTYLQYFKDVIFAGVGPSYEDIEETKIIEEFWSLYQRRMVSLSLLLRIFNELIGMNKIHIQLLAIISCAAKLLEGMPLITLFLICCTVDVSFSFLQTMFLCVYMTFLQSILYH